MTDRKKFFQASFVYALAQVLGLVASLVSFPILTRILNISEYGILGLCNTILLFGTAASKLGLQNSIVRFFPEYRQKQDLRSFYSTFWLGGGTAAAVITLIALPAILYFAPAGYHGAFVAVALMIFGNSVFSIVSNFLRSEEKNAVNAILNVLFRYVGTFGGIALVYWVHAGIAGIFWAQLVVIAAIVGWYLLKAIIEHGVSFKYVSRELFSDSLKYGLPLIAFEFSSIALAFSDRFLITHYLGATQLGLYIAGYTICFYISDIIRQPLQQAVMPIYLRIYTEQGAEKTAEFLSEITGYVFLVILPVFAGVVAIRTELIILLSSQKYLSSAVVIPWVLAGTLLYACQPLVAAGFYLKKQTGVFSIILVASAAVNVVLNIILIPRHGMLAAAWSTAISYILALVVMMTISSRSLPLQLPFFRIMLYGLSSFIMYAVLQHTEGSLLAVRILSGIAVYTVLVLMLDRKTAREIIHFASSRYRRWRLVG